MLTPLLINKIEATAVKDVNTNSFPLYLDCGKPIGSAEDDLPKWANINLLSAFSWALCTEGTSGVNCYTNVADMSGRRSMRLDDMLSYYQFGNGRCLSLL